MVDSGGQPVAPRIVLTLGLTDQAELLSAALLSRSSFDGADAHATWLRDRYAEIVPSVLPEILRCLERGDPLDPRVFDAIQASARAPDDGDIPLTVVLRGGVPALRVFSAFLATWDRAPTGRELVILTGRAALVICELGACWTETWTEFHDRRDDGGTAADVDPHDLVPVPGHVESPELEMLALVASGHSTEQIGEALAYSPQAVKWHLARVMRTWNVNNRAALVSVAFLRGVLTVRRTRPARDTTD